MPNRLNLKTLEDLKKGINELVNIDNWTTYKIRSSPIKFKKKLDELFLSKLGILPCIVLLADSKSLPLTFYRLRKAVNHFNETLISEYSYPPNRVVKSVQRANIPYHPVFYCSDDPVTAIYETVGNSENLNTSCTYYLSEWNLRENENVRISPFIFGNLAEGNPYKSLSDICTMKLRGIFCDYTSEELDVLDKILEFLSQLFIFENTYVVSSYIANYHLYAGHNLRPDIFIYPSYQTKRKTVNFAVHPNAASEKFILKRVFKLRITEINRETESTSIRVSHIGKNENGIIFWKPLDDQTEEGKELIYEVEKTFNPQ